MLEATLCAALPDIVVVSTQLRSNQTLAMKIEDLIDALVDI